MAWIVADFKLTNWFSLRPSSATTSGGKSLLVPTPFALKMALLSVICQSEGEQVGRAEWPWVCNMLCALRPPKQVVVNHTAGRVLRPRRPDSVSKEPMQSTLGYREYVQWDGPLGIGFQVESNAPVQRLSRWLANIQYVGKRGSFVQLQAIPELYDVLPDGFIKIDGQLPEEFGLEEVLTELDDTTPSATFDRVNIYSSVTLRKGVDRVLRSVVLPYRLVSSSQQYSLYCIERE